MPNRFDEFLHLQNIMKYQQHLAHAEDDASRKLLLDFLAEESAKARKARWSAIGITTSAAEPRSRREHGQVTP
jgi:hypothetical protein